MPADTPPDRSRDKATARVEAYQDRLEKAVATGRAAYDAAFDDPPSGVGAHEIDLSMVLKRVNSGELAILGYTREQMVGRHVTDIIVMEEASKRAIEKKFAGTLELKPFVRTFRRSDGTPVTLLLLDRHLKDAQGRVVGIRTVLTEVDAWS